MAMEPRLDIIGAALADVSRSQILCALMDGRAFTNKELACVAGIAPQTASAHLKHLQLAGLTSSLRSGRHIYHRIADKNVAGVLEAIAGLSPTDHLRRNGSSRHGGADIFRARSCYNHIAGRLGVLLTERLIDLNVLQLSEGAVVPGDHGNRFFSDIGLPIPSASPAHDPVVKLCLDWTERRHHISGPLATQLMQHAIRAGWLERRRNSRALTITERGYETFDRIFGVNREMIEGGS
ncbi:MAG: ArsR family transcriptional regulator [Alphaproteobacteria bacterium]|nr:ArsR family transcriptional regulator [Alphaproteobacteria bacterium]